MLPVEENTRRKEAVITFRQQGEHVSLSEPRGFFERSFSFKSLVIKHAPKWTKKFLDIYVPCHDTMPGFTIFRLVLDLRRFKNQDSSHEMFSNITRFTHESSVPTKPWPMPPPPYYTRDLSRAF